MTEAGYDPHRVAMLGEVTVTEEGFAWLVHEASEIEAMRWGYEQGRGTVATISLRLESDGVTPDLARRFANKACELRERAAQRLPALVIGACVQSALVVADEPMPELNLASSEQPSSPRFPTGIETLDALLDGGLYGVAALSGAPKVGKSLLALVVALEAMRAGWTVIYGNAEMTRSTLTNRLLALCGGSIPPEVRGEMIFYAICRGISLRTVAEKILSSISLDTQRLLVVIDSINTTAEMMITSAGDGSYWNALRDLGHLAMQSRRASEGKCSWLLVSEQNARGELKGLKLQYTADVVVAMKALDVEGRVEISVPYARESRSGKLGTFTRDWRSGRFRRLVETPVGEGDDWET